MAKALSQLNVRLGFIFDTKSLAAVEKNLQRTGQRLAKTGTDISLFISAPLAILGANAVKAAGEFESLSLAMQATFKNAGRTIEEANTEVEALRKAAQAPGLDFPQAIAASIRLQSVGLSAEKARATIQELANAVASTGGTAQQLESVTVQMAQMISKGKVLSGDLRIIQENLPIISDLMLKAFGTANAEKIQELGLTGKDFVEGITKEMTKLTRVEGGISNALVNAGSAIKQALAGIGEEIARTFNITKLSDRFSESLTSIVAGFKGLSDGTKKAIVVFGGLLVAIGPATVAFGALASVGSTLIGVYKGLISPISSVISGYQSVANAMGLAQRETVLLSRATVAAEISTRTSAVAARTLTVNLLAMQAALTRVKVALGVIGIVAGLAVAVYAMSESFDAAKFASEKFAEAQAEVISSTSKEIGLLNQSFDALKDETKGRIEKGKVVDALLNQYPQYLKGIDLESASVERLTEIQKRLNAEILRGVAERQKAAAVTAIYEEQAKILLRIQQLRDGQKVTAGEASLIDTGDMLKAGGIAAAVIQKMEAQASELGKQVGVVAGQFDRAFGTMAAAVDPALKAEYDMRDAAEAAKDALYDNATAANTNAKSKKELTEAEKARKKELKETVKAEQEEIDKLESYAKMIREIEQAWKDEADAANMAALEAANADSALRTESIGATDTTGIAPVEGAQPLALGVNVEQVTAATTALELMRTTMAALTAGTATFGETFNAVAENIVANGTLLQNVALAAGEAMQGYADQGGSSLKELALTAAAASAKIVRGFIQEGVARAAASALEAVPFPFNIIAAGAAGAIAGTLFNKLISSIGIPAHAKGTRDAPGGLSLVGERGPELVQLPRHSRVFPAHETNSMLKNAEAPGVSMSGEFSVRGTDLVLILDRVQQKQKRTR